MNTHDKYELPPPTELYFHSNGDGEPVRVRGYTSEQVIAAIEADRKQRHLKEEAQLEREWAQLRAIQAQIEADRKRRGEPVGWFTGRFVIEPKALFVVQAYGAIPAPGCELFTAPQPAEPIPSNSTELGETVEPVKVPSDEEIQDVALRCFEAEVIDIEHEIRALLTQHGVKWYWAQPGKFEAPGVYYWNGEKNVLVQPDTSEPDIDAPPCWWINHGSHGQITQRQDEAAGAAAEGKIVVEYARRFCLPAASAEPVTGIGWVDIFDGQVTTYSFEQTDIPAGEYRLHIAPVAAQPSVSDSNRESMAAWLRRRQEWGLVCMPGSMAAEIAEMIAPTLPADERAQQDADKVDAVPYRVVSDIAHRMLDTEKYERFMGAIDAARAQQGGTHGR